MHKNKACLLCWCPYGRCVINDLEWQHCFELFLQFGINVSQWNFKKKTTDKFIIHVAINFLNSWDKHFLNRFFAICNVFHNCVQIITKERLGLVLFRRDGRVITNIHIFFWFVSNLAQRVQPSENKILHKCFTIFTQLQSIVKSLNCSPIFKQVFLSIHSSRILSAWIT